MKYIPGSSAADVPLCAGNKANERNLTKKHAKQAKRG